MQFQLYEAVKSFIVGLILFGFAYFAANAGSFIFQPNLIYSKSGDIEISSPQTSQAFYDELLQSPRNYFISSDKNFELYFNILTPEIANSKGRYSANIFLVNSDESLQEIATVDGLGIEWVEYYEPFSREYYLKGPVFDQQLTAGKYKIEIHSAENTGKYVLAVGLERKMDINSILGLYWSLPVLKLKFFGTDIWQLFFTPLMIALVVFAGLILVLLAIINYFIGIVQIKIRQAEARTILLTSGGMLMKTEISKLLQKPAYDITVAFIVTAGKTGEKVEYLKNDYFAMKEMGFNVLEIDIEGKTEQQVRELIRLRDIIFIEDGNAFLLLKSMRKCNFAKIMQGLLKEGKVYLGVGSGSIVAGKTIRTASWLGQKNEVGLMGTKGLNLVNFDIFPHYSSEWDSVIKKKLPFKWQRKKVRIITDKQAVLSQGKNVILLDKDQNSNEN